MVPDRSPSAKPKVLVVSTNADLAGAPNHVRDLVFALRGQFAFTVVFGESGPIRDELIANGIPTAILPGMRSAISPLADARTVLQLYRIVRRTRPAIIHAHSSKAGLVARAAGLLARVPVAYTVHGWGFGAGRPKLQSALVRLSEMIVAPLTQAFLAVSKADAQAGRDALRIAGKRLHVVPNGVPEREAPPSRGATAGFIMVARTDYAKNHQTAISAFSKVACSMHFTCVGGGTDDPEFAEQARGWAGEAAPRLRLLGSRGNVPDLLASHSVFVLSSRYEGMPLSIIEAMRSGLPVIASRVGGVPELVVDGETGILFEAGDVDEMSRAMQRLIDDPQLCRRMGDAGRKRYLAHFTVERMGSQIAAVYESLIDVRTPGIRAKQHANVD